MQVEGRYTFEAPSAVVWTLLMDPHALSQCMPGCERLEPTGENTYEATLKVGVAAVRGTYVGKLELTDMQPPTRYTMAVEGSGSPGFIRGTGVVELEELDGRTIVTVRGEAHAGGLIAGVGQRMLGGVAKMIIGQFFSCMTARVAAAGLVAGANPAR